MKKRHWAFAVFFSMTMSSDLQAQDLKVVGVARNDVLKIREWPGQDSRVVGVIPFDAAGIQSLGQIENGWLFVRYGNVKGWVGRSFVMRDVPRGGVVEPGE